MAHYGHGCGCECGGKGCYRCCKKIPMGGGFGLGLAGTIAGGLAFLREFRGGGFGGILGGHEGGGRGYGIAELIPIMLSMCEKHGHANYRGRDGKDYCITKEELFLAVKEAKLEAEFYAYRGDAKLEKENAVLNAERKCEKENLELRFQNVDLKNEIRFVKLEDKIEAVNTKVNTLAKEVGEDIRSLYKATGENSRLINEFIAGENVYKAIVKEEIKEIKEDIREDCVKYRKYIPCGKRTVPCGPVEERREKCEDDDCGDFRDD